MSCSGSPVSAYGTRGVLTRMCPPATPAPTCTQLQASAQNAIATESLYGELRRSMPFTPLDAKPAAPPCHFLGAAFPESAPGGPFPVYRNIDHSLGTCFEVQGNLECASKTIGFRYPIWSVDAQPQLEGGTCAEAGFTRLVNKEPAYRTCPPGQGVSYYSRYMR